MIRRIITGAVAAAALVLGAPVSHATVDPEECQNFARPVIISDGYDPLHLDTDGDGIACEGNPGEPVKTDLYADLRGEGDTSTPPASPSETPTLAHTGDENVVTRHPVRTMALGAVVIGTGLGLILVFRRKR
jgi:hypothetical protein